MKDRLLTGLGKYLVPVPSFLWKPKIVQKAKKAAALMGFMTPDHHRVRNFVVKTLAESGNPLSLTRIAMDLDLDLNRVSTIVDELERAKLFLFRNPEGEVAWAYPITVEKTPHRAFFSTGENAYAA